MTRQTHSKGHPRYGTSVTLTLFCFIVIVLTFWCRGTSWSWVSHPVAASSRMSLHASITSLLSRDESRSASTGLLVIGVILGGSAVSAALWLQSTRALRWPGRRSHRSVAVSDSRLGRHVVCVLDGLPKSCRSDAIEVATCFGITEIWVGHFYVLHTN